MERVDFHLTSVTTIAAWPRLAPTNLHLRRMYHLAILYYFAVILIALSIPLPVSKPFLAVLAFDIEPTSFVMAMKIFH